MSTNSPSWVELEGGANTRDVGGLPTVDDRVTRHGALIRSANLQHLTDGDLAFLVAELGVRTVVDLRTDVEVDAEGPGPLTRQADVTIHHLSLFPDSSEIRDEQEGRSEVTTDDSLLLPWHSRDRSPAITGNPTADLYLTYLDRRPDSVVAALKAIAEPGGATVVHCAAGKDRTGVVIAIALALVGVQRSAIVADYAATEGQIAAIIQLLRRTETYRLEVADPSSVPPPKPEVMDAVLNALDAREDGIAGWLGEHGWTTSDTERLRAKLLTG
jgi:protein-tyrosine phosphatase